MVGEFAGAKRLMRIRILAVGAKMPGWVADAANDYLKRIPRELPVQIEAIAPGQRTNRTAVAKAIAQEGDLMLSRLQRRDHVVALDLSGQSWSTPQLAKQLGAWREKGDDIVILIGGPDGLDARCLARAQQVWCLSNLTLPHPLVRVLLAEQLYRAWSITQNHPYHR